MSKIKELQEKFDEMGVTYFHATPGPNIGNYSAEECADEILRSIKAVEKGLSTPYIDPIDEIPAE